MRASLFALALVACASRLPTWQHAWAEYAQAECEWKARCDGLFVRVYETVERCARDLAADCDEYLGARACDTMYPTSRGYELDACLADFSALPCDAEFAPDSCGIAFTVMP